MIHGCVDPPTAVVDLHGHRDLLERFGMVQFHVALSILVYSSVDLNAEHVVQLVIEFDFPELLTQCVSPPVSEDNAVGEA